MYPCSFDLLTKLSLWQTLHYIVSLVWVTNSKGTSRAASSQLKINHDYRELVPTRGRGVKWNPYPSSCCGRENIIRRGEDEFNFPTVKRDNVDIQIPNWNQNSIFFLDIGLISCLWLDLINPKSSFSYFIPQTGKNSTNNSSLPQEGGGVLNLIYCPYN